MEPNISAWRRANLGDMTSALRLDSRDTHFPKLQDPTPLLALEELEAATLPLPTVPAVQTIPHQEPGGRPHTRPPAS